MSQRIAIFTVSIDSTLCGYMRITWPRAGKYSNFLIRRGHGKSRPGGQTEAAPFPIPHKPLAKLRDWAVSVRIRLRFGPPGQAWAPCGYGVAEPGTMESLNGYQRYHQDHSPQFGDGPDRHGGIRQALGLAVPLTLQAAADEVIE